MARNELSRGEIGELFNENYRVAYERKKIDGEKFKLELSRRMPPVGTYDKNCLPEKSCTVCEKSICIFGRERDLISVEPKPVRERLAFNGGRIFA